MRRSRVGTYKRSLKDILIFKSLLYSFAIYALGIIILIAVMYFSLSSDHSKIDRMLTHQTSMVILPDIQDGNYYGIKHNLDQLIKSGNFKGMAFISSKGDIIARGGDVAEKMFRTVSGMTPAPSNNAQTINVGNDKIIVRGVYDQNGIMWGTLIAVVNKAIFLSLIRNVAILLLATMFVVLGVHTIVSCAVVKKTMLPLAVFTDDINKIVNSVDRVDLTDKRLEKKAGDMSRLVMSLKHPVNAGGEIANLLESFRRLMNKTGQFWDAYVENANLAAIGRISSQLAHDMRTPLSVIKVLVERIGEGAHKTRDITDIAESAARSMTKLNNMAEDLVDYSKAQNVARVIISVDDLIKEVLNEMAPEAHANKVSIGYKNDIGISANVDGEKINRVLANLVINAIQAHEKPGSVMVEASAKDKELSIVIVDDGKGIPADKMEKIFERSFTFGKPKGTGLGLAYCKQVIEAHGGKIEVASEVQKGSTFTVRLPSCIVKTSVSAVQFKSQIVEKTVGTPAAQARPSAVGNILIADDDMGIRLQWIKIIQNLGGTVVCAATNPDELMRGGEFDYSKIDTAIVDYQYEGHEKTGIDLIAYLKSQGVRNVHLCTGFHADPDVQNRATQAGAKSVLAKPIDEKEAKDALC